MSARDVVIEALTDRLSEEHGEQQPRDWKGGDQIIRALQEAGYQIVERPAPENANVAGALQVIAEFARYDGSHHKQWVFDQAVRELTGCPAEQREAVDVNGTAYSCEHLAESEAYREFRAANPYWREGVAP